MMRAGYWLNYSRGTTYTIDEHEQWLRRGNNALILGLPPRLICTFKKYVPQDDRFQFLSTMMEHAPIMRVRGHGEWICFEFGKARGWKRALSMVRTFLQAQEVGDKMYLSITNLVSKERVEMYADEFQALFNNGGYKAIVKNAVVLEPIAKNRTFGKRVSQ